MIDHEARRQLASLLKKLATGKITNDDYQDLVLDLTCSTDASVAEIAKSTYMAFDHPTKTYRFAGKDSISRQGRRRCAIWLLFLHSDCETGDALHPVRNRIRHWLLGFCEVVLTAGTCGIYLLLKLLYMALYEWWWCRPDSKEVDEIWPFNRIEDLENARKMTILGGVELSNIPEMISQQFA